MSQTESVANKFSTLIRWRNSRIEASFPHFNSTYCSQILIKEIELYISNIFFVRALHSFLQDTPHQPCIFSSHPCDAISLLVKLENLSPPSQAEPCIVPLRLEEQEVSLALWQYRVLKGLQRAWLQFFAFYLFLKNSWNLKLCPGSFCIPVGALPHIDAKRCSV